MTSTEPDVRFGVSLVFPWIQDEKMDEKTKDMQKPVPIDQALQALMRGRNRAKKIAGTTPVLAATGANTRNAALTLNKLNCPPPIQVSPTGHDL